MAQVPFTTAGVQQKQTELYALPDSQLTAQADLIRADFRQWIKDNFTLDTAQQTYLDGIDDRWIQLASAQSAFAIQNRLPIDLYKEPPQDASKLVRTSGNLTAEYTPGGFVPGGTLSFHILYVNT